MGTLQKWHPRNLSGFLYLSHLGGGRISYHSQGSHRRWFLSPLGSTPAELSGAASAAQLFDQNGCARAVGRQEAAQSCSIIAWPSLRLQDLFGPYRMDAWPLLRHGRRPSTQQSLMRALQIRIGKAVLFWACFACAAGLLCASPGQTSLASTAGLVDGAPHAASSRGFSLEPFLFANAAASRFLWTCMLCKGCSDEPM